MSEKIKIGLSSCLAGDEVRYNGQGCRDKLVMDRLSEYFEYVKTCPEMAIGMGTPRPTIRLVKDGAIHLRETKGDGDYTEKMESYSTQRVDELKSFDLCGYIFKKGSPSCGAYRVKVYSPDGQPLMEKSSGVFALKLQKALPWMPVEEDGRLNDPPLFENFIFRVNALSDWRKMMAQGLSKKGLTHFHRRHKYALMAHNHNAVSELGNYLAQTKGVELEVMADYYLNSFMETMSKPPKRLQHANVLYHLLGYFKKQLDSFDKQETVELIERYRMGYVPLVVPITRIAHYVRKFQSEYLSDQSYLDKPVKLGLLNNL